MKNPTLSRFAAQVLALLVIMIVLLPLRASADPAHLAEALKIVDQTEYRIGMRITPYPERIVEMNKANGRLDELGLTWAEGLIVAEAMLVKMGITPVYPTPFKGDEKAGPTDPFRTVGEFEPMKGVIISYPVDYWGASIRITFNQMAEALDGDPALTVYMLADNSTQQTQIEGYLDAFGVTGSNFEYLLIPTNSVWSRDYGPIFLEEQRSRAAVQSVLDMKYYPGRPQDDAVPGKFAAEFDLDTYSFPLYHEGGNFMTDGNGTCFTSTGIFSANPGLTIAQMEQHAKTYWGCDQYISVKPLIGEGTTHIDMYSKFLDPITVIVNEAEPGDPNYARLEEVATTFSSAQNLEGTPYEVIRIPMPEMYVVSNPPYTYNVFRSYTNSSIFNDKALVPIYNIAMDDDGLAVYEDFYASKGKAMQVIGIDSEVLIEWLGAVHCVTMEQAALPGGDDDDDDDDDDSDDDDTDDDDTDDDDTDDDDTDDDATDDDATDDDSGDDEDDDAYEADCQDICDKLLACGLVPDLESCMDPCSELDDEKAQCYEQAADCAAIDLCMGGSSGDDDDDSSGSCGC